MNHMKVRHLVVPTAVVAVAAAYSGLASIGETVLSLPGLEANRANIMAVAPQGWSFFTKSPRDPQVEPHQVSDAGLTSIAGFPNTRVENAFGLSREGRSQGVETALLIGDENADAWVECSSPDLAVCSDELIAAEPVKLDNAVPSPTICGEVVIVQSIPVSWAYRNHTEQTSIAQSGLHAEVSC